MAANFENFQPNRELLNSKFEGYKLSSDTPNVESVALGDAVNIVSLRDDVFSHLHVKAFAWTNHLVIDEWTLSNKRTFLYFVDVNYSVQKVCFQDGKLQKISAVFKIPITEEKVSHQLNVCITFPNESIAAISDGVGNLFVVQTSDRTQDHPWIILLTHGISQPFSILHCRFKAEESNSLGVLLLSVTTDDTVYTPRHNVILTMVILHASSAENGTLRFIFQEQKEFQSQSVPLYAALDVGNDGILIASEKPFSMMTDAKEGCIDREVGNLTKDSPSEMKQESTTNMKYTWSQDKDCVTILFTLEKDVEKNDITFDVKKKFIKAYVKNGDSLLEGELYGYVEADACTWTYEGHKLEITLAKSNADELWTEVVSGDPKGIYDANGSDASMLSDMINDKTGNKQVDSLCNPSELEECDSLTEDTAFMVRIDLRDGQTSQKTSLSTHQWLFTKAMKQHQAPAFCIRHDVDALVWQPSNDGRGKVTWDHIGTLDAFGFVHASKKEQKFTSCSPDMSYAVICDAKNLVFTYHRHSDRDAAHAKQKLLRLDNVGSDGIVGMQACNDVIFVLGKERLFSVTF